MTNLIGILISLIALTLSLWEPYFSKFFETSTATSTSQVASSTATSSITIVVDKKPISSMSANKSPTINPLQIALPVQVNIKNPLGSGWQIIWNDKGLGTAIVDTSAPFSSPIFQLKYVAGFEGGSAPASAEYLPVTGARKIHASFWWRANADWQGHPSNVNKLHFIFFPEEYGDMVMVIYGPPGGPYELRSALQLRKGDTRAWLRPNVGDGQISFGNWHHIEWEVSLPNDEEANGVVKWWLDSNLVGDYEDINFPPGINFTAYKISPTWGGIGGMKEKDDYFWFGGVEVGTQ